MYHIFKIGITTGRFCSDSSARSVENRFKQMLSKTRWKNQAPVNTPKCSPQAAEAWPQGSVQLWLPDTHHGNQAPGLDRGHLPPPPHPPRYFRSKILDWCEGAGSALPWHVSLMWSMKASSGQAQNTSPGLPSCLTGAPEGGDGNANLQSPTSLKLNPTLFLLRYRPLPSPDSDLTLFINEAPRQSQI